MTNMNLINEAVQIVINYWNDEEITELDSSIRSRAIEWTSKMDIPSADLLAAAVISGNYQTGTTIQDLSAWKEFYFFNPFEETVQNNIIENFMEDTSLDEYFNETDYRNYYVSLLTI